MTESANENEALQDSLEELVLDRDALPSIEKSFLGFNVFEALGHTHAEERHSNFLGFLLDPQATHGLGDAVLREFILRVVKTIPRGARPVDLVNVSLTDFSATLLLREHRNIDILGLNDEEHIVLVIENKIRSSEHSNQLQRYREYVEDQYPNYKRILVYLTPDGDEPTDREYIPYSYTELLFLLQDITEKHTSTLAPPVLFALEHYLEILRRHVVSDEELVNLAKSIYQKHKRALEFIFEQRPDLQSDLSDLLGGLISESGKFVMDRHVKTYINFVPREWDRIPAFNATPKNLWTKSGRTMMLEFRNAATAVQICLVLGPTEDQIFRDKMYEFCRSKPDIFKGITPKLYSQFATLYSKKIVSKRLLEEGELSTIEPKIRGAWTEFLEDDLPKIRKTLEEQF